MKLKALVAGTAMAAVAATTALAEPGVSDDEILIGDVAIMSGPAKFVGDGVTLGSRIAAAEINANGGIHGRMIRVITEDDGYVPSRSVQAARKLFEQDEVFTLNGTSGSSNVLAMLPIINEQAAPVVVTTAPNSRVYEGGAPPTVFSFGPDYWIPFYAQTKYIAENLVEEGANFGLIVQDDDFGDSVENGYDKAVRELGLNDVLRVRAARGQSEYSAEMLRFRTAGIDALISGAIFSGQASVFSEARKFELDDLQIATVWTSRMPMTVRLLSPHKYPYLVSDYVVARNEQPVIDFIEMAREYVGDEAENTDRYTLTTYIGLKVLAHAMEKCGRDLTRACTVEELGKIENFDTNGLSAPITFDETNHVAGTAVKIYQFDPDTNDFKALTDFVEYDD